MATEQDKTLEGLQMSIQMEIDGKEYYLKVSQKSSNETGKSLLKRLAAEEDLHKQKFQQIYSAIRDKKAWPDTGFQPDGGKKLRTIFADGTREIGTKIKAHADELEDIQIAMTMENKTYDFYQDRGGKSTYDAEKEFYKTVAAEERGHYLVLLDYFEYLKDPSAWFIKKEHHSLDGG